MSNNRLAVIMLRDANYTNLNNRLANLLALLLQIRSARQNFDPSKSVLRVA